MFNGEQHPKGLSAAYLGRVKYEEAWELQRRLFHARSEGRCADSLLLLEHPPIYTLGRRTKALDLVWDEAARRARSISLCEVDRGGRATYHGPGQLVAYPIMALGERYDVIGYLRRLEEVLILSAADVGVEAARDSHTGVWVGGNKLAAIGVKITRGVTMHGFALNVTTDLTMFEGIVPCGIEDHWVTSIEAETGRRHSVSEVATVVAGNAARVFGRHLTWVDPDGLLDEIPDEIPDEMRDPMGAGCVSRVAAAAAGR